MRCCYICFTHFAATAAIYIVVIVVVVIVVVVDKFVVIVAGVLVKTIPKIIAAVFQVIEISAAVVYVTSVVVMLDVLNKNVTKVPITPLIIHFFQPSNSVDEQFSLSHWKVQFPQVAFFKQHQYWYSVHLRCIKGRARGGATLIGNSLQSTI